MTPSPMTAVAAVVNFAGEDAPKVVPCVTLDDALRYAEERVAEALRAIRSESMLLEANLANAAWLAHHPDPIQSRDRRCGAAAHNREREGSTPSPAPNVIHVADPGDEHQPADRAPWPTF